MMACNIIIIMAFNIIIIIRGVYCLIIIIIIIIIMISDPTYIPSLTVVPLYFLFSYHISA